jgi:hypothetical protein
VGGDRVLLQRPNHGWRSGLVREGLCRVQSLKNTVEKYSHGQQSFTPELQ